ncbi:MAG: DUF502 domain-containing protein [Alphaproteobacteria bacterium]
MNARQVEDQKRKKRRGGVFWRLRRWFIAGLLATAPIGLTVWLVLAIVDWIDRAVKPLLPPGWWPSQYLPFELPGVGLVVALVGITVIGALTTGYLGRLLRNSYEGLLGRLPVVRGIYAFLKQVLEMVFQNQSGSFREVVLFEYPRHGTWTLGFITGVTQGEVQSLTEDELVNVFVPTTPNPTSGFFLFVPRKELVVLSMSVEEGIKMVVSGGMVTPEDKRPEEERAQPTVASYRDGEAPRIAAPGEDADGQAEKPAA